MRAKQTHGMILVLLVAATVSRAEVSVSALWAESLAAETESNYAEALELHRQILPTVGKSYAAHLRAGWLYYKTGNYPAALKHYELAAGQSSGALSPLYGAMNSHIALGNSDKVIKVAKAILVIDELNYTASKQLAASYYAKKKFSVAAAYYRKLNRLYPEDLAVASGLAWSYLEQGETRKASLLFKEILLVSPEYAYAEQGLNTCKQIDK